jgi:hypothetical protein
MGPRATMDADAAVAELVDALALGASTPVVWRFKSSPPHHFGIDKHIGINVQ